MFTAVIQRVVGTDKNDWAGAAVPTIHEFFQRSELRHAIACMCVNGVPNSTVHPTLYPLLLLIAKLKVAVVPETVNAVGQSEMLLRVHPPCSNWYLLCMHVLLNVCKPCVSLLPRPCVC